MIASSFFRRDITTEAEEAGQRSEAIRHLRTFVKLYDCPPPAHAGMVEEAKSRLARLENTDAPKVPRRVP